ncbi:retrotransposon protein [Tanacetum coccineum]
MSVTQYPGFTLADLALFHLSFCSHNHVRKFLRALPTKWRPKVTDIEESKDLSILLLDELIGNLKVYEVVLEKDSEASKSKKEKYKLLALKSKKVSSDEEVSCSDSDDEEYAMVVWDFKKFFRRRGKFVRKLHDDKNAFQRAKGRKERERITDSDEDDDPKKDKICLMAHDLNEKDKKGIGFTKHRALNSEDKMEKMGQESAKKPSVDLTHPIPSEKVCSKVSLEPDQWIKDSGYTKHMTGNNDLFSTYEAINGGNMVFGRNTKARLLAKCKVLFSKTGSEILNDGITIGRGIRKNGLYVMKIGNSPKDNLCLTSIDDISTLWH